MTPTDIQNLQNRLDANRSRGAFRAADCIDVPTHQLQELIDRWRALVTTPSAAPSGPRVPCVKIAGLPRCCAFGTLGCDVQHTDPIAPICEIARAPRASLADDLAAVERALAAFDKCTGWGRDEYTPRILAENLRAMTAALRAAEATP